MKTGMCIGALVLLISLSACDTASLEPKTRPSGVPDYAVWVGGADGGAYVHCTIDVVRNLNPCKVWNDYTGGLVESGDYRLIKENRAAKESELRIAFPDFSGKIYLESSLVLQRLQASQ